MFDSNTKYIGHISRYDKERGIGFIESVNQESYFFAFDYSAQAIRKRNGEIPRIHEFSSGDEVEFKLKKSLKKEEELIAYDVTFIKNIRRQKLVEESISRGILHGYLKKIDETYFVKHDNTYVFVKLYISNWEIDYEKIYYERIDKLVHFRMLHTHRLDKLSAVLTDRKYCSQYTELLDLITVDEPTSAFITGKNTFGLCATLLNGSLQAFIPLYKQMPFEEIEKIQQINVGDYVDVKIKFVNYNKTVSLSLY